MKGRILGFNQATGTGAIAADTGERYSFGTAQWRGERTATVGTVVDFEPVGNSANDIYPVAAPVSFDASAVAASPGVRKLRILSTSTLAFPLAVLLLIATLLPAMTTVSTSVSLWGLGNMAKFFSANPMLARDDPSFAQSALKRIAEDEAEVRAAAARYPGGARAYEPQLLALAQQRAKAEQQLDDANYAATMKNLLFLRYLVPLAAIALLALAWAEKPLRLPSLATGVIAILTFALVWAYRSSIVSWSGDDDTLGSMISAQMGAVVSLGLGSYCIALCGVGLVLAGMGIVSNPLATKADPAPQGIS